MRRIVAAVVAAIFVIGLASCGPAWKKPVYEHMDKAGYIVGILYATDVITAKEAREAGALLAKAEAAVRAAPETYAEVKAKVKYEIGAALLKLFEDGRLEGYQYEFLTELLDRW